MPENIENWIKYKELTTHVETNNDLATISTTWINICFNLVVMNCLKVWKSRSKVKKSNKLTAMRAIQFSWNFYNILLAITINAIYGQITVSLNGLKNVRNAFDPHPKVILVKCIEFQDLKTKMWNSFCLVFVQLEKMS